MSAEEDAAAARVGKGRKEGALRMLRVLRQPGPVPYTWRPPRTEDT